MSGNPYISEIGKDTRFGSRNGIDPKQAQQSGHPPWSIRKAIRRIAAMSVDDFNDIIKSKKLTAAQIIAIRKFQKALSGDVNAMKQIEDAVDGKIKKQKNTTSCLHNVLLDQWQDK